MKKCCFAWLTEQQIKEKKEREAQEKMQQLQKVSVYPLACG